LVSVLSAGCTHTRPADLASTGERDAINRRAAGRTSSVVLEDGRRVSAVSFRVEADSASWVTDAGRVHSVAVGELRSIRTASRGRGALEGLAIGAGIGGLLGLLGAATGDGYFSDRPLAWVAASTAAGAEVGALVGLVTGRTRFVPVRTSQNGAAMPPEAR
jgi:hypothetical protein